MKPIHVFIASCLSMSLWIQPDNGMPKYRFPWIRLEALSRRPVAQTSQPRAVRRPSQTQDETGGQQTPTTPTGGDAMGGQPEDPVALIPKRQPTPEDACDGLDDDSDDVVDEGVSNVCGGCGGIPRMAVVPGR